MGLWTEHKRLSPALVYGLFGILGAVVSIHYFEDTSPALFLGGLGLLILGGGLSLVTIWNWVAYHWQVREDQRRRSRTLTPFSEAIRAASQLTPEQARIVPRLMYQTEVGVVVGAQLDIGFVLSTPTGGIPYAWIEQFLSTSGTLNLRSINSYPDKTAGRNYAVSFTGWLVEHGFAIPHNTSGNPRANGPHAAAWVTESSKDQVRKALRIDDILGYMEYTKNGGE